MLLTGRKERFGMSEPRTLGTRRKARVVALQALYEIDAARHTTEQALQNLLEAEPVAPATEEFTRSLVYGVLENQEKIDSLIEEYAPSWPIGQIVVVDRNILRVAIYEIIMLGETPTKVAINEAVELAKAFGADNSPKFVNGVLGSVVSTARLRA